MRRAKVCAAVFIPKARGIGDRTFAPNRSVASRARPKSRERETRRSGVNVDALGQCAARCADSVAGERASERCYAGFVDFADFSLGCQAGEAPYSRGA